MKSQVEIEYQRYAQMQEFVGKPVPMFEDYLVMRGLNPEDHLTPEELADYQHKIIC